MQAYGLRLVDVKSQPSFYKRSAVFRAETNQGVVCIKPYHGSKVRLKQIIGYWTLLQNHGFRYMPRLLKAKSGIHWTGWKGRMYYVTPWIHGTPFGGNEQDFKQLGRALGKLHQLSRRLLKGNAPLAINPIFELKREHKRFRHRLPAIQGENTEKSRWFRDKGGSCLSLTDEALKILARKDIRRKLQKEITRPCLIHGDVTLPNVVRNSSGIVLIDWDQLKKKSAYFELAKTICNTTNFTISRIAAFLQGYQEKRPLNRAERMLVSALFRIPREAWYASRLAASSHSTGTFQVLQKTWEMRLAAVEWLDKWAKA